jgi:hypothetical protein
VILSIFSATVAKVNPRNEIENFSFSHRQTLSPPRSQGESEFFRAGESRVHFCKRRQLACYSARHALVSSG